VHYIFGRQNIFRQFCLLFLFVRRLETIHCRRVNEAGSPDETAFLDGEQNGFTI